MPLESHAVTVTTSPTALHPVFDRPGRGMDKGLSVAGVNTHATSTLWIGGVGVTPSNGTPVAPGRPFSADLPPGERLYGCVSSGTLEARVMWVEVP